MAHQSVFSYSDVIRLTAKTLTLTQALHAQHQPSSTQSQFTNASEQVKTQITLVAKVYTALSKNVNYNLKKYLSSSSTSDDHVCEIDIPQFGAVSCRDNNTLNFQATSTLAEELAGSSYPLDKKHQGQQVVRKDINLGKIAEVCMMSRDQVKNIIQAFSIQIVS